MQVREQGRQVQLIRSPYDSVKKRCVQKVVATFKQSYFYSSVNINDYLSASQLLILTDGEKKTLSDWLINKSTAVASTNRASVVSESDKFIGRLTDAILADGIPAYQAAQVYAEMDKLAKALKKMGHPRSSLKPVKATAGQSGQVAMEL